jgi:hypothetical protein
LHFYFSFFRVVIFHEIYFSWNISP